MEKHPIANYADSRIKFGTRFLSPSRLVSKREVPLHTLITSCANLPSRLAFRFGSSHIVKCDPVPASFAIPRVLPKLAILILHFFFPSRLVIYCIVTSPRDVLRARCTFE